MIASMLLSVAMCVMTLPTALPTVEVTADDTVISQSCRVVIPPGTVIEDANGDGVIQIAASNIEIEFAEGSVLRGSPPDTRPDEYRGYGIRLNGRQNVSICDARISGYWCGLWATGADGLTLDRIDASDNRRAYLKSTPVAEDGSDWLFPHHNDNNEWLHNYAAAIYVEDSSELTVRGCRVWHGQNGLCLDRVADSRIYDNDFSFNSGWGIALWRCNRNVISRNAIDFCVRGYSHGVYNRGQDSAGILMFEQNHDNVIAENSATHGGDCFFGFAGREALGEVGQHPLKWYKRRGNHNNLLINNDFSYAPAHGIEMTFSFGNQFIGNRLVGNAICGVWGGYSQHTLIAGNHFEGNGEMGYGLERGGVNIEHGKENRIVRNKFRNNKCGVHLWWDPDEGFAARPWARANGVESTKTVIAGNEFVGDDLVFHFRLVRDKNDPTRGKNDVTIGHNEIRGAGNELKADAESEVNRKPNLRAEPLDVPDYPVYGQTRPIGARQHLRGRQNIVMTEWGPWDHESPLVRLVEATGRSVTYDLHKMPGEPKVVVEGKHVRGMPAVSEKKDVASRYTVESTARGVHPYVMRVSAGDFETEIKGTLINATWDATFFKWSTDVDPREDLERWRGLAGGDKAILVKARQLAFKYGVGGPSEQNLSSELKAAKLGGDYFGMIATTRLWMPAGKWEFMTISDDGVRVTVDGKPVIDNWTWHPPRRDTGTLELAADKTVEIVVEHFEIDGWATLELQISRVE
ncbi:MAG: right-handed parallel beta-helix repeat-containing protein [Phycisphaerae bacterium]